MSHVRSIKRRSKQGKPAEVDYPALVKTLQARITTLESIIDRGAIAEACGHLFNKSLRDF